MKPVELELLQRFKTLLGERLRSYELIAFGSRARGDADEDSDLDVLVLIDEPETYAWLRFVSDCAWEACFGKGIVLSPVVYSRERWENEPSLLASAIEKDGVPV